MQETCRWFDFDSWTRSGLAWCPKGSPDKNRPVRVGFMASQVHIVFFPSLVLSFGLSKRRSRVGCGQRRPFMSQGIRFASWTVVEHPLATQSISIVFLSELFIGSYWGILWGGGGMASETMAGDRGGASDKFQDWFSQKTYGGAFRYRTSDSPSDRVWSSARPRSADFLFFLGLASKSLRRKRRWRWTRPSSLENKRRSGFVKQASTCLLPLPVQV